MEEGKGHPDGSLLPKTRVLLLLVLFLVDPAAANKCEGTIPVESCPKNCNATDWTVTVKATLIWTNINCCGADEATGISWWKYSSDGGLLSYDEFGGSGRGMGQTENHKMLTFYRPNPSQSGRYRCLLNMPGGKEASHNFRIIFHGDTCKEQAKYPILMDPVPQPSGIQPHYNMPGKSVSLPCDVKFGYCPSQSRPLTMNITWLIEKKQPDGTTLMVPVSNVTRIQISMKRSVASAKSVLTIHDIKTEDYRKYVCHASDGNTNKSWSLELREGLPGTGELPGTLIIYHLGFQIGLALVLLLILTVSVATPVMWKHRLNILLWRHSHPEKDSDNFKYSHDALVVHAGTNPGLAGGNPDPYGNYDFIHHVLFKQLEEMYRYKLFVPLRDLGAAGYAESTWIEEMEKSKRVIFIMSEQFLREELCSAIFSYSIRQKDLASDRNIYIIYREIPKDLWDSEKNDNFDNLETLKTCVSNARKSWLKTGRTLEWSGAYTNENDCFLAADETSAEQIKVFWKKLCLALPPKENVSKFRFKPKVLDSNNGSAYSSSCNGALIHNECTSNTSDVV